MFGIFRARPLSQRRPTRLQLVLEPLEERAVLSTLHVVPVGTQADSSHFHSFQGAYGAAVNGDVIQVEQGASVRSVGTVVRNRTGGGQIGSNTITIDQTPLTVAGQPLISAGEVVQVSGGGGGTENFVVSSVHYNFQQIYFPRVGWRSIIVDTTLTLHASFQSSHNAGATVTTLGRLGIAKSITLQGNPTQGLGQVQSDFVVAPQANNVAFDRLQFNGHELDILFAAHGNKVTNSSLGFLSDEGFDNRYDNNVIGAAFINADNAQLTNNVFTGDAGIPVGLWILQESHDVLVQGNTFSMDRSLASSANFQAILSAGPRATIRNNTITVKNADKSTTGIYLYYVDIGAGPIAEVVVVENNVISTVGKGTGLQTASVIGGIVSVKVQGNDFRNNAIGVGILGDGSSAGNVDLGGGALGSLGQNNFQGFTPERAAAGDFAVSLHRTRGNGPDATVWALNNLFSVADPNLVVRDGIHNTTTPENSVIPGDGTGLIMASQSQGQAIQQDMAVAGTVAHEADLRGVVTGINALKVLQ